MPKKKTHCVCSLINKLALFYGSNLEGEIFFKHSPKCKAKTQVTYHWTEAGYERRDDAN